MSLILAIEPDRYQANQLTAMVRGRLRAELVLAGAAETALANLGQRVPDLILTSALLSTKDETMLAEWLRTLSGDAAHVQTLTIPVLETPMPVSPTRTGIFALLPERVSSPAAPDGCDPAVFAEQCAAYLERSATERSPVETTPAAGSVAPHREPEPAEEVIAAVEAPPEVRIAEPPPPPPPAAEAIEDSIEIDLSGMLDDKVFQQLSEAIETVSRDSSRVAAPATTKGEVWTPSSLGSAASWPGLDFAASAHQDQPPSSTSARSAAKRFPARKPLQDEWGFFDPAQCGFSALLAKLDEITHVAQPAEPSERQSE
jgi:hypothetical protein